MQDKNLPNAVHIAKLMDIMLDSYHRNYEAFMQTQDERLKSQQQKYEAQMMYRKHLEVWPGLDTSQLCRHVWHVLDGASLLQMMAISVISCWFISMLHVFYRPTLTDGTTISSGHPRPRASSRSLKSCLCALGSHSMDSDSSSAKCTENQTWC